MSTGLSSAPEWVAYCPRCAAPMVTTPVMDKPRRRCPDCGFIYFTDPKVGVGVLLSQNGRVLLVRRGVEPEKGKWSIPAGYVDHGEDPRETAAREVLEETGLLVAIDALLDVYHNPPDQGGASIFILYGATLLGGEMQPGDDADQVAFFDLPDLPELAFANTRLALAHLAAR